MRDGADRGHQPFDAWRFRERAAAATTRSGRASTRACIWQKPLTDLPIPLLGQPPVSPARDATATGARDDAVQTASRADLAHREQFSWLRMSPNQVRECRLHRRVFLLPFAPLAKMILFNPDTATLEESAWPPHRHTRERHLFAV